MKVWHIGLIGSVVSFLSLLRYVLIFDAYDVSHYDLNRALIFYSGVLTWLIGAGLFGTLFRMFFDKDQ